MKKLYEDYSADKQYISDIPGVDPLLLLHEDLLKKGKHAVADIFLENTPKTEQADAKGIMWQALREAGYGKMQTTKILARFWQISRSKIPHDQEFFRARNDGTRKFMEDILDRLLEEESVIEGHKNVMETAKITNECSPIAICSNHPSQIDPLIISTLLKRMAHKWDGTSVSGAAMEIRDKLLAIPGHKVMLDGFQRGISRALHCLFTLQGKYRPAQGKEKDLVNAYMANVGVRLKILLQHPDYIPLIFPEGGLTREDGITFESGSIISLRNSTIAPVYMDNPESSFRLEGGKVQSLQKTRTNMYIGKPFEIDKTGTRNGLESFIEQYKKNLLAIGAPIENVPVSWKTRKE